MLPAEPLTACEGSQQQALDAKRMQAQALRCQRCTCKTGSSMSQLQLRAWRRARMLLVLPTAQQWETGLAYFQWPPLALHPAHQWGSHICSPPDRLQLTCSLPSLTLPAGLGSGGCGRNCGLQVAAVGAQAGLGGANVLPPLAVGLPDICAAIPGKHVICISRRQHFHIYPAAPGKPWNLDALGAGQILTAPQSLSEPDIAKTCQQLTGSQACVLLRQADALAWLCMDLPYILGQPPSATLQAAGILSTDRQRRAACLPKLLSTRG